MKTRIVLIVFLFISLSNVKGQIGRLALSPVQKVEQVIGKTNISLVYSRPLMRGRTIFGGLVPYDKLWRTGANRNTTIEFDKDVIINNKRVEEGKYALMSIPNPDQWEIILYSDTDNWNVPAVLDSSKIVCSLIVDTNPLDTDVEAFTISIGDFTNYEFSLNISWSNVSVSIPIQLITKELMDERISRVMNGPSYVDYYAAAEYQMESGREFEKGLVWINKAIEVTEDVTWWDLKIKAKLLLELNRNDEALKVANEGMAMAKKVNRSYGINEFNAILSILKE